MGLYRKSLRKRSSKKKFDHLRNFGYHSIDVLLEEGVDMQYHPIEKCWGLWLPDNLKVQISPKHPSRNDEDVTILHEWLHAYEDLIVYLDDDFDITVGKRSPDKVIDDYAYFHHSKDSDLVKYVRSFFENEGF